MEVNTKPGRAESVLHFLMLTCLLFLISSCSTIKDFTEPEKPWESALSQNIADLLFPLMSLNTELTTFKGIGKLSVSNKGNVRTFRMAWMGENPGNTKCGIPDAEQEVKKKLRIELLAPHGKPVISFSYDGNHIYLYSHKDKSYFKKDPDEFDISYLFDIPVAISDLVCLLTGRPPVNLSHEADVEVAGGNEVIPGKGPVLKFKNGFLSGWDTIRLTPDKKGFDMVERYDFKGSLKFRAVLENFGKWGKFNLPERISISEEGGNTLFLEATRFFPNADLKPGAFVITPPE